MAHIYDTVIIGGGPGGYTAALYAARAGLSTLVLEKLSAGGQMALTTRIDNYPGFPEGIDGFTLGEKMQQAAEQFGARTEYAKVESVENEKDRKVIHTDLGPIYGRTVIYAAGANPKTLGLPGEQELLGKGVNYCAACDGAFYKDKTVVVVGGGNSAAADALLLSRICRKVILVHRRDTLRATRVYHQPLLQAENVEFLWSSAVTELCREEKLTGVKVLDLNTGKEQTVACDGLFISIGRAPATEPVKELLTLDPGGYIPAGEDTRTEVPGLFAVGDVRTKEVRQIVTAVADGAVAAHQAEQYLAK